MLYGNHSLQSFWSCCLNAQTSACILIPASLRFNLSGINEEPQLISKHIGPVDARHRPHQTKWTKKNLEHERMERSWYSLVIMPPKRTLVTPCRWCPRVLFSLGSSRCPCLLSLNNLWRRENGKTKVIILPLYPIFWFQLTKMQKNVGI